MSSRSTSSWRVSRSWEAPAGPPGAVARLTARTIRASAANASGVLKSSSSAAGEGGAALHHGAREVGVEPLLRRRGHGPVDRPEGVGEPIDHGGGLGHARLVERQPRPVVAREEEGDHHLGRPAVENIAQKGDVAQALAHLLVAQLEHLVVHPDRRHGAARGPPRTGRSRSRGAGRPGRSRPRGPRSRGRARSRPSPSTRCASPGGRGPTARATTCPRRPCAPSRGRSRGATPSPPRAPGRSSRRASGPRGARSRGSARRGSRRRRRPGRRGPSRPAPR